MIFFSLSTEKHKNIKVETTTLPFIILRLTCIDHSHRSSFSLKTMQIFSWRKSKIKNTKKKDNWGRLRKSLKSTEFRLILTFEKFKKTT